MLENIVDNWIQWLILCWLSFAFCYRGVSEKVGQSGRAVFEAIAGMLAICGHIHTPNQRPWLHA